MSQIGVQAEIGWGICQIHHGYGNARSAARRSIQGTGYAGRASGSSPAGRIKIRSGNGSAAELNFREKNVGISVSQPREDEGDRIAGAYEKSAEEVEKFRRPLERLVNSLADSPAEAAKLGTAFDDLAAKVANHTAKTEDVQKVIAELDTIIQTQTGRVRELATSLKDDLAGAYGIVEQAAKSANDTIQRSLNFSFPGAGRSFSGSRKHGLCMHKSC